MVKWLGGTASKQDFGEDTSGKRNPDDDTDEEAIGAFRVTIQVSRFSSVSEVEVLIISSYSRHLELFPNPQVLLETYSSKDLKLILAVPGSFSYGPSRWPFADFAAVPDKCDPSHWPWRRRNTFGHTLCCLIVVNKSQRVEKKWNKDKLGSSVVLDGSLDLRVGLLFYPAFVIQMLIVSKAELKSPSGGCVANQARAARFTRSSALVPWPHF